MNLFTWNQNLETGFNEVDKQHRQLFELTNQFGGLLAQNTISSADVESLFQELVSYTQYHFNEEEKLMGSADLSGNHARHHEQEHRTFLREFSLLRDDIERGQNSTLQDLLGFLFNWLVYHILGTDMNMARQMHSIEQGLSPEQAYARGEEALPGATGLLMQALDELFQQVSARNRQLMELNQTLEKKVEARTRELSEANSKLQELATTDVLTGLPNRRYAMYHLQKLWEESGSNENPLACLLLDADGFKQINDSFGHDAGDLVLLELARELGHTVRSDDIVCRLGGDEFLVICPATHRSGALQLAHQLQQTISGLRIPVPGGAWQGSLSIGVGIKGDFMNTIEDLIKLADRGLYAAKAAGKNCVMIID